jgi:hypothetical protein
VLNHRLDLDDNQQWSGQDALVAVVAMIGSDAMGADYIPEQDVKAAYWMKHLANALVGDPQRYRTTPDVAAEVLEAVTAYRVAQAKCWPSGDRNAAKVCAKNNARKRAERIVRPEAQRIRKDPRIDLSLKVLLGLNVNTHRRRKIPVPTGVPLLRVQFNLAGAVTVRFLNSENYRTARPHGVAGIELWEKITPHATVEEVIARRRGQPMGSDDANDTPDAPSQYATGTWRFVGLYTHTPIRMRPPIQTHGDEVAYMARWVTPRGEPGAFGNRVSVRPAFNPLRDMGTKQDHHPRRVA